MSRVLPDFFRMTVPPAPPCASPIDPQTRMNAAQIAICRMNAPLLRTGFREATRRRRTGSVAHYLWRPAD